MRTWVTLVVLFATVAGCSADPPPPAADATPTPVARDITLAFAGDVHFIDRTVGVQLHEVTEMMADADLAMVNLETAVTRRGTPEPKTFRFRAAPGAFARLKAAGIDVVSVANNHTLDYGRVGLADTLTDAIRARMPVVGAGPSAAEAFAPHTVSISGTRIAVLGMSHVSELWQSWRATDTRSGLAMARDAERTLGAVRAARKVADVVIVYLHWGTEYQKCPSNEQKTLARKLSAAGADVIVGTHAHVLLGDGWLGRTYVHYGLSNFVWWRNDAATNDTEVLRLTVRDKKVVAAAVIPAYIDRRTGVPARASGSVAAEVMAVRRAAIACSGLAVRPPA